MKYIINQIRNSFSALNSIFSYTPFVLIIFLILVIAKIILLRLVNNYRKKTENQTPLLLFSIPLMTYIVGEIAFIIFLFSFDTIAKMILRIAWHMQPIHFFAQVLFLQSITQKQYYVGKVERLILQIFFGFIFLPLFLVVPMPVGNYWLLNIFLEFFCRVGILKSFIIKLSGISFLVINVILSAGKISNDSSIPAILKLQLKQLLILLFTSIIPEVILLCASVLPSLSFLDDNIALNLASSALFTASLLFFVRRIYHLRFLNLTKQVEAGPTIAHASEQLLDAQNALCQATNIAELPYIHETFFSRLAGISCERITFIVRTTKKQHAGSAVEQIVEQFMQDRSEVALQFFTVNTVLVYDELAFTQFYEQSKEIAEILSFMEQINATVFIALKDSSRLFGAIIITKDYHKQELFSRAMQTQMQLYGTYVTYTLLRFEQDTHQAFVEEYKKISLELYQTNQKNVRFHESISSLLKPDSVTNSGILFYKNTSFTSINATTEELLQIDPNKHAGHPLTKALKELVRRVTQYGTPQTIVEKNISGVDICCQGFPYKKDEIVILIAQADITRSLPMNQTLLNATDIDYAIFLHSTQAGTVINRAIAGGGTIIQQAKINLLKILLSKKSMILDVHEEDVTMILSIAQKVCYKSAVRTIDLDTHADHDKIATLLCGKQRFTSTEIIAEHGLLYTCDDPGIIHIANAHRLEIATQKLLLQFLKTGSFCLYKSESRHTSNATIILSSSDDLPLLVKKGLFLKELYDYLKDAIITLPNLSTLPFAELDSLARSFQKQLIIAPEYYHLFGFSDREQEKLDSNRPVSYHELQKTISVSIKQRMNQSALASETTLYTPKTQPHDPMLLDAARLGKQTLKNRKLMRELWEKFKNQSKIAQLLGVDKSSVHRRLKQYGIGDV